MKIFWVSLLLAGLCLAKKEEETADDLQAIEGRRLEHGRNTPCSGCATRDKTSSQVVVPTAELTNLINDKKNVLTGALPTIPGIPNTQEDLLLKIGDVVSFLQGSIGGGYDTNHGGGFGDIVKDPITIDELDIDIDKLTGGLGSLLGIVGGIDGGGGKLGKIVTVLNVVKKTVLDLGARGLEIANFILAIIGLALIAAYVAGNDGELGILGFGYTGTGSGSGSGSAGYSSGSTSGSYGHSRSFMDSPMAEGLTNLVYDAINKYY